MVRQLRSSVLVVALLTAIGVGALVVSGCGGDDGDDGDSQEATLTVQITEDVPTEDAEAVPTVAGAADGEISFDAASASITVDGDASDWDGIEGAAVTLQQIEIPPSSDWDEPGALDPIDATLRVATDAENMYVLVEVPDDFDFNPEDHNLSASLAVQFLIDQAAGPHMGAADDDLEEGLGMVDIWHWELDCGPGEVSGGGIEGGDDPNCNFDDEYATDAEEREDDGGGDDPNPSAENGLTGVWEHTGRAEGAGAEGSWIFEMSRPLQTGDPQDGQFESGGTALLALAYFDADETATGWTDTGHLQSADLGWIEVTLP